MNTAYHPFAKTLHWLMALLLLGLTALGLYMSDLPLSPDKLQLYAWHKWAGVTAFFLLLVRLVWSGFRPPPAPLAGVTPAHRMAAQWTHGILYVLMATIPLSGWLMSSAKGFQTVWFGVLPLPDLLAKDQALGDLLSSVHSALTYLLVAVVVAHAGAALWHHFMLKDGVLRRMLSALLTVAALAALALPERPAHAVQYQRLAPQGHRVEFSFTQMGVPMKGHFSRYSAQFKIDPAKPAAAQGKLVLDLSSIETGSAESNEEVATKAWFHTREFPQAIFVLEQLQPLGAGRFEALGKLSLKGTAQALRVPLQLSPTGLLTGGFTLQRSAFRIGEGPWAKFDIVANDIQVQLRLQLQ